ncbi:MAG: ferrochelatase [Saprospiraceae bacterium]|nr:ferrochelatase [Saprospiraceae bacterium]
MSNKRGIVLMNLGSPDSTKVKDVRRYLAEFLMDERVIDVPYLVRLLLVRGIIAPFRAPKSAKAYKSIWTDAGSPLMVISKKLRDAVQQLTESPVEIAMRYGSDTPKEAFDKLLQRAEDLEEVVVVPMYPHYAMSSYETAVEYAKEAHKKYNYSFKLTIIEPFYDNPIYLNALADSMRAYTEGSDFDHFLFSYHGIPERHILKSDITKSHCLKTANCCETPSEAHKYCYKHQCTKATHNVAAQLGIPKEKYSISFQSRLGRDPWLQPFTDKRLTAFPTEGVKNLVIACPAFVSDCLETLEEIAEEGQEMFLEAGGTSFKVVPCMNIQATWVEAVVKMIEPVQKAVTVSV